MGRPPVLRSPGGEKGAVVVANLGVILAVIFLAVVFAAVFAIIPLLPDVAAGWV
jgi:hypothetical protein